MIITQPLFSTYTVEIVHNDVEYEEESDMTKFCNTCYLNTSKNTLDVETPMSL